MARLLWVLLALSVCTQSTGAQVGSVLRSQKINDVHGGFTGTLQARSQFGGALAGLGDLDGDGRGELAVGAPFDDDGGGARGAIWILRLGTDGTVVAHQKISQTQGGFTGTLADGSLFGKRLAGIGDLDGDGVPDLAALSESPHRFWILFLNPDGTVKAHRENLYTDPAFVPATLQRAFRSADVIALGDVDRDGDPDLAIGAPQDAEAGHDAGALWIIRLNPDGSLQSTLKIGQGRAGFTGSLDEDSYFSYARLGSIGDLDGDGNIELLVGTSDYQNWILFLNADQSVRQTLPLEDFSLFHLYGQPSGAGQYFSSLLGDLDGDGNVEVALGVVGLRVPSVPGNRGGVAIHSFDPTGAHRRQLGISHERGGLGPLPDDGSFGMALATLGDLDGDGTVELAVGAPFDNETGGMRGALHVLFLNGSSTRKGAGLNPNTLTQAAEPALGSTWSATLDCSGHAPALAAVFGGDRPLSGKFLPSGELLVDLFSGRTLFLLSAPHAGGGVRLSGPVPSTPALFGLPLHVQGICYGAPAARLSNALDVVVGN